MYKIALDLRQVCALKLITFLALLVIFDVRIDKEILLIECSYRANLRIKETCSLYLPSVICFVSIFHTNVDQLSTTPT